MGFTIAEKILASHSKKTQVRAGDLIQADIDVMLGNDVTAPLSIKEYNKIGADKVFDPDKIFLVMDHFVPNKDIKSAEQVKVCREFAFHHGIKNFFDAGRMGIEHVLLPEQGYVLPGDLIIGADSHTCTYGALGAFSTGVGSTDLAAAWATGQLWFKVPSTLKINFTGQPSDWLTGKDLILYCIGEIGVDGALYRALEFYGEVFCQWGMDARFTISNMAIEAGGKAGIFPVDTVTEEYLEGRAQRKWQKFEADPDAQYEKEYTWDISEFELQVSRPHLPENTVPISEIKELKIDQVVIGSCTNGRESDLALAAKIMKGKKVAFGVRCIIFPGTQKIYLEAVKKGWAEIFVQAGAVFSTPTCGPCLGGHMGVLAKGEKAISTTNRNFVGRMGDPESEVYLSGVPVAAASAIKGEITHPDSI